MRVGSVVAGQLSYSSAAAKANTLPPPRSTTDNLVQSKPLLLLFPCQTAPTTPTNWRMFFQCHLIFCCIPAGSGIPPLKRGPRTAAQAINSAQTPRQFQALVIYGESDGASLGCQERTGWCCTDTHCNTVVA